MKQVLRYLLWWAVAACSAASAGDLPREGNYDFTACWSGAANPIEFADTKHRAFSYEMTGMTRSNNENPLFDRHSFRCIGLNYDLENRKGGTAVCEAVDRDGDRRLTFFTIGDGKIVRETVAGTGKYEGMTDSGKAILMGPYPQIKPGTFQSCNRQTGTYKLK